MKRVSKFLLYILGWRAVEPPAPEPKCIILGVPHTSAWDFIISYLYYRAVGGRASVMVKKSFFVWPLGAIVKAMGGIPVDRSKGSTLVLQIIREFQERDQLHLAIAPEGTRKATNRWKTGFHTIAKRAQVPIYLGYFDWKRKEVGRGERFELTEDVEEDLKRIKRWYIEKGVEGKYPSQFTP